MHFKISLNVIIIGVLIGEGLINRFRGVLYVSRCPILPNNADFIRFAPYSLLLFYYYFFSLFGYSIEPFPSQELFFKSQLAS